MNPLHTPLPNHYLAKLYYKPARSAHRLIDWSYFIATDKVSETAYKALGVTPKPNYVVEIRRVTPHELGMTKLETRA